MAKITRFKEYSFTESMIDDFIISFGLNEKAYDDYDPEVKEILSRFKDKFGDKRPTNKEFADFYFNI